MILEFIKQNPYLFGAIVTAIISFSMVFSTRNSHPETQHGSALGFVFCWIIYIGVSTVCWVGKLIINIF